MRSRSVALRPSNLDDAAYIARLERLDENRSFVNPWPVERHRALMDDEAHEYRLVTAEDGHVLGFVILARLTSYPGNVELARIVIDEKGRGYGRAAVRAAQRTAFDDLGAHRLCLDLFEDNERALHVYASEGFVVEGKLREIWRDGEAWRSLVLMSILEQEYRRG